MEGAEAAKRSGLPSGTLWRDHLRGETWITHGDVGGATDFFMVLRQDLQKVEDEPPDPTAHDAGGTFCRAEGNERGRLMRRAARSHGGFSQRRHPEQRIITQHAGRGSVQAKPA